MTGAYQGLLRRALFASGRGDAETAHHRTLAALERVSASPRRRAALARVPRVEAPTTVFGIRFPNPVGLAAGMDKDAVAIPAWAALGFGFVEVGTVTWHAQPGNPRPRLHRLVASEAIVNRMGFNNAGARAMAARLRALGPVPVPVGISLGKSKITPVGGAPADYLASLEVLLPYADYVAVNVSSPNTPGLRDLQDRAALDELLQALRAHTVTRAGTPGEERAGGTRGEPAAPAGEAGPVPLLVKIAPDLSEPAVAQVLEVCVRRGIAGIIATNTTIARDGLQPADRALGSEAGGLSGRPVHRQAVAMVGFVARETGGKLPVIGVGGIHDADDAARMFAAGAALVQLYTGFVYRGPGLVRDLARSRLL